MAPGEQGVSLPTAITLGNWQDPPFNRSAFWQTRELLPTHRVGRGDGPVRDLPVGTSGADPMAVAVGRADGTEATVGDVMADTYTDAYVVLQDGELVGEWYAPQGGPDRPHALMSVTKSVVGCVAGNLVEQELLETQRPVTDYVPELLGSGYAGASVRDVLDMRTGVRFREDYTDPDAEFVALDEWIGWRPADTEEAPRGLYRYLATLGADGSSGGNFRYRSTDSDVLGWVCERAGSERMANLMSALVWAPMGAETDADLLCDGVGTAVHDGGLAATARDLARFGQLLLDNGSVPVADGEPRSVVPSRWLRQAWGVDSDLRTAFAATPTELTFPGGWYRNQFWFRPGEYGDVLLCLGIFGQMVHVCRRTRTVCVKLSTWPKPQDPFFLYDTCAAFDAVGGALAGRERSQGWRGLPGIVAGLSRAGGDEPTRDHGQ
ncbi:MAG TPA: serine hydrolase [Candidatus Nanopelagicales bacterium]